MLNCDNISSGLQGGNILHGAVMGALAAGQGQVLGRYGGRMRTGARLAVVVVVGGTVAELGGGKFANGAMTAAFAFLFNESMHERLNFKMIKKIYSIYRRSFNKAPTPHKLYELLGGQIQQIAAAQPENFANGCAARLSYAMNLAGIDIPEITGQTIKGSYGLNYFIRASDMSNYLNHQFGEFMIVKPGYKLFNGLFYQTGHSVAVSGHIDVMYKGKVGYELNQNLPVYYWYNNP